MDTDVTVETDRITKNEWDLILGEFKDASLEQTWAYGQTRWGENNLSHLILKLNDKVIAAAQVRIIKIPLLNAGIAYIPNGPIWLRNDDQHTVIETFKRMLEALKQEYVINRGLLLRIIPNMFIDNVFSKEIKSIFSDKGFKPNTSAVPYKTLLLDIKPSMEEHRKHFHKKWRKYLGRAERNDLNLTGGTKGQLFDVLTKIYKEMVERKKFVSFYEIEGFKLIQKRLPENLKLKIIICEKDGVPMAGILWSEIGNTARTLFSATGNEGLKVNGAYILRWQMLEQLKIRGLRYFDQGGIDKVNNPGSYHFKSRFGGQEANSIGQYEMCRNVFSSSTIKLAEGLNNIKRYLIIKLKRT